MKTKTLVAVGLVGASLAGCEVRCLSPKNPPPRTQTPGTDDQVRTRLVAYDAGVLNPREHTKVTEGTK
jgi:hypothetical protein